MFPNIEHRQCLVMGTASWPWSHSHEHTFIEPELVHLLQRFERIIVVPQVKGGARRNVPAHVEVFEQFAADPTAPRLVRDARKLWRAASLGVMAEAVAQGISGRSLLAARRVVGFAERTDHWTRSLRHIVADQGLLPSSTLFYSYWCDEWALGAAMASLGPTVCRTHRYDLFEEIHEPPFIPFRPLALERLEAIFHVSRAGLEYQRAKYPRAATKMRLARLGVLDPGFSSRPSTDGQCRVVSCSALLARKRVGLLLAGLCRLASSHPSLPIAWTHFGGGPLLEALRADCARAPRNLRVELRGPVPNDHVLAYYRDQPVDVFAHASESEGLPVVLQEAAGCGLPIVAAAVDGVPEVVTDANGVLLPKHAPPEQLAAALWTVFSEPSNWETRAAASRRIWADHFDAARNHAAFADELLGVLLRNEREAFSSHAARTAHSPRSR